MQFIFVEFWVTVDFTRCGVNHGHWHFVFGIEVKQTNCSFQFNRYFSETSRLLRERIDNASIAFLKSVSIFVWIAGISTSCKGLWPLSISHVSGTKNVYL